MGWMQELAGKATVKGQVVVTRSDGGSTTYTNIDTAEAACDPLKGNLRFFRGAFFQSGAEPKKAAKAPPAPPAPPPAPKAPEAPKLSKRRRSKPSE